MKVKDNRNILRIKYFFEQTQSADVEDSPVSLKEYIELMLARLAVVYQDYEFLDRISFISVMVATGEFAAGDGIIIKSDLNTFATNVN